MAPIKISSTLLWEPHIWSCLK